MATRARRQPSDGTCPAGNVLMNNIKVFVLMAGMTALFIAVGGYLGGQTGALWALVLAAAMNVTTYYASSTLVLRAYGARIVSEAEAPELYAIVDRLRQRAGLPMPVVAIAPHEQPNAFATGRNARNAVVCVTQGLLEIATPQELEAVLGHELAHVIDKDMLLQTVAATMAGAIANLGFLARWGMVGGGRRDSRSGAGGLLMVIVAPIAAMLIQFAISRQRELKADEAGSRLSGRPHELASALRKLDAVAHRVPMNVAPSVAPLAIVNPLSGVRGGVARLFSTHPSTEERVRRLEAMPESGG